jgi:hypothetical protein
VRNAGIGNGERFGVFRFAGGHVHRGHADSRQPDPEDRQDDETEDRKNKGSATFATPGSHSVLRTAAADVITIGFKPVGAVVCTVIVTYAIFETEAAGLVSATLFVSKY